MKLREYSDAIAIPIYEYLKKRTDYPFFDEKYGYFRFSLDSELYESIHYSVLVLKNRFVVYAFFPDIVVSFSSWVNNPQEREICILRERLQAKPEINPPFVNKDHIYSLHKRLAYENWKVELMTFLHYCNYYYNCGFQIDEVEEGFLPIRYRVPVDCTGIVPSSGMIENSIAEPLTAFHKMGPGINTLCEKQTNAKEAALHCNHFWKYKKLPNIKGIINENTTDEESYWNICICEGVEKCGLPEFDF